jgi:hypothetical protein
MAINEYSNKNNILFSPAKEPKDIGMKKSFLPTIYGTK